MQTCISKYLLDMCIWTISHCKLNMWRTEFSIIFLPILLGPSPSPHCSASSFCAFPLNYLASVILDLTASPIPWILFYSLLYPQCLEQCLAGTVSYWRMLGIYIVIGWIDEWLFLKTHGQDLCTHCSPGCGGSSPDFCMAGSFSFRCQTSKSLP